MFPPKCNSKVTSREAMGAVITVIGVTQPEIKT